MKRGNLDKVLFALSYCYLLGVVLFLVAQNKLYLPLISPLIHNDNSAAKPPSPSDARFIKYMQRVLTKLDRQVAESPAEKSPDTNVVTPKYTPIAPISQLPTPAPPSFVPPPPPFVPPNPVPSVSSAPPTSTTGFKSNETEYTLIGLFESGSNSVALFSLKDVVSRFSIGQQISSTGWYLESVTADSAVLVKNGVKRTIGIGQKL